MTLQEANTKRWNAMRIPADNGPAFKDAADRITANKDVYKDIEKETGVPWWFIGVVHLRESNLDMKTNIANGQRYDRKTTIVPEGRGPFKSFKEAAIDALVNCGPYAAKNKDWSVGGALTLLEKYNGLGYYNKGVPSPYIWAGTDQYVSGKYVADGVYSPTAVDKQLGCAGVIKFLGVYSSKAPQVIAGAAAAGGTVASLQDYFHLHPYAGTALAFAIGLGVWGLIHWYRNRAIST